MITLPEYESVMADPTKRIEGDLDWRDTEDRRPACTFRTPVLSRAFAYMWGAGWLRVPE